MKKEICIASPCGMHWFNTPLTAELFGSAPMRPVARQPLWVCASFQEAGFSVSYLPLYDLYPVSADLHKEKEHITKMESDVLIISPEVLTSTTTYYSCGRLASAYKEKNPSGTVVLSGYHASTLPEQTLEELEVDVIAPYELLLMGQGRMLIEDLLEEREPTSRGVTFRGADGRIHTQEPGPSVVEDLSTLPPPAYSLLLPWFKDISHDSPAWINLVTSRGCPFSCAYCSSIPSPQFRKIRFLSPESVEREVDKIQKTFGKAVCWEAVYDEFYAFDLDHVRRMNSVFKERDILFSLVFGRCTHFSNQIAEVLTEHTKGIIFGAESCNQASLDAVNKNQSFQDILTALKIAKEHDLTTVLQWIVGLPRETSATIYQTLVTMNRLYTSGLCDRIDIQMLVPFPWTDIFENSARYDLEILSRRWDEYNELGYYPVYRTETLSRHQIWSYFLFAQLSNIYARALRKNFPKDVYKADIPEIIQYFNETPEDLLKEAYVKTLFDMNGGRE